MLRSCILACFSVIIFPIMMMAQDKTVDSLKAVLVNAKEDTAKVNTLITLSKATVSSSAESSLSYAIQAKELAAKLKFTKGEAYALKYIGMYYYTKAQNVSTLGYWLQSLELFHSINDKLGISNIQNNIGAIYNDKADYEKALEYLLPSLTIAEELGDKLRIASALQNIGNTYSSIEATKPQALQYLLRALSISEELQDQDAIVTVNTNIGEIYLAIGKTDSALYFFKKGLSTSKNSEKLTTTFILNDIGKAYTKMANYDLAIRYQKQAVVLARKLNAQLIIGKSLLGLADTYFAKGDIPASLIEYNEAEKLLLQVRAVEELKDLYAGYTQAYAKLGDKSKAFDYQTKYAKYKDTLYNIERDKKVSSLQFNYDIKDKQSKINSLTKDQALKELDLQKQKNTRNALAVGVGLLLIIAFVIYRNYRIKVKTNIILDKQKVEIENLMHNILPEEVAAELQQHGKATPRHYDTASVLFTDFKSFTSLADKLTAQELIEELSDSFVAFDDIIEKNQLEKIKTIGDSYMCAGGIPTPNKGYVTNLVNAGLEMQQFIAEKNIKRTALGLPAWELRIGIHVGPIVAGVVGKKKYAYDIWGNTVNIASRMESNGEPGRVNISASTYELIKGDYACSYRGKISAKNVGEIDMYFVDEKIKKPKPEFAITEMENNYSSAL